ncbi:MAG: putative Zn-dependent protease [Paraglaciecola sp.]|jgi:predicted Zn-dependent protease
MLRPFSISNIVLSALLITSLGLRVSAANKKNDLPEIGVVASGAISLDKEIVLGDALMRQLRGQAPIINDPLLEEYIQDLGNRLVAQADNVKFPFKFFLINSPDINAFAFFGGHVGVHSGLIFNAKNESELASVLAHEVSHVTQRHIARSIEARQKSSPLQLASALGGILLAMANPEAGIAAISASTAAAQQASINYTRSNEKEADRVGIGILAQAGFDPSGASSFFSTLTEKYRLKSNLTPFLMTHPLPESRIADARTRAAMYAPRAIGESLNFHLAKARIQARYYANGKRNIEYFAALLEKQKYVIKVAAEYGLALSYLADEQYGKAQALITKLLTRSPDNLFFLDTFTDIALATGHYQQAIDSLTEQALHTPHNRVLSLNLANAKIKNKQFTEATNILKDYLLVNPTNRLAYQLLSDAYGENQQKLEMHQSKAEVYALSAAYPRAIDELQNAYNFASERQLEKQRIRARIEQLRTAQERLQTL